MRSSSYRGIFSFPKAPPLVSVAPLRGKRFADFLGSPDRPQPDTGAAARVGIAYFPHHQGFFTLSFFLSNSDNTKDRPSRGAHHSSRRTAVPCRSAWGDDRITVPLAEHVDRRNGSGQPRLQAAGMLRPTNVPALLRTDERDPAGSCGSPTLTAGRNRQPPLRVVPHPKMAGLSKRPMDVHL